MDGTTNGLDVDSLDDPYRAAKDIFAGTVGGIAQVLVGQPFDTTKVRIQSAPPGTYSSAVDVVRKLLQLEGPLAFYKGTLTPLIGIGAVVSVQFGVNEYMKRFFNKRNNGDKMTMQQFFISGSVSGLANSFLASPIEHIRIRLQTQTVGPKVFTGPIDVIQKLYKQGGIRLIYRGLGATLLRESIGAGSYFLTFEALVQRDMDKYHKPRKEVESWKNCLYGGLAGYAMWLSIYPVDVLKSNLQADNYKNPKFKTYADSARFIFQKYGIRGFFKGFITTLLRAAPANAATFVAFEETMRLLG
ncbi:DEKNAAC104918 [Brettanomyces naardenensis]|uniref:DEKNAAC104918 n=1 Tax=Brettanomyces naardenensis TaxID=13370 RepID=A0A448YRU2_BRENA|nr:DEKNAAC104918 [Brettanomyces naardenensis]